MQGHRLLVIATTSLRPVLAEVGLSEAFDSELRVPPISNLESFEYVLRAVELFETDQQFGTAINMLAKAGFPSGEDESMNGRHIGIKKLLSIIEMARQEPDHAVQRLIGGLMGLGM
jgi:vesicle-fusing ATPase